MLPLQLPPASLGQTGLLRRVGRAAVAVKNKDTAVLEPVWATLALPCLPQAVLQEPWISWG